MSSKRKLTTFTYADKGWNKVFRRLELLGPFECLSPPKYLSLGTLGARAERHSLSVNAVAPINFAPGLYRESVTLNSHRSSLPCELIILRYPISTQEVGKTLMVFLKLRVSTGGDDHMLSVESYACGPLSPPSPYYPLHPHTPASINSLPLPSDILFLLQKRSVTHS
ncbi:hypothetical protein EVAR_31643_1 [Eumeta japonica]|uniref:Uncharacterized protein n=1 Tax=Eumeta variegata TaxID=151549 RepID=A0A4C1W122_EUMVA|nr:hypothetical protein EVAR_31643_1 [Eumeta japonica]